MDYDLISQDEQDEVVANAIRERQKEHYHYELNKQNYQHILEQLAAQDPPLPEEWPAEIAQYKNMGSAQLAAYLTGEQFELANKLAYRDRIRTLLATETAEQLKSEVTYNALKAKLPDNTKLQEALARVDAKAAEVKAAAFRGA